MMKITEFDVSRSGALFRVEGEVSGAWVRELQRVCEPWFSKGCNLTLDLAEVTYVDREGLTLLRLLISLHVTLTNLSPYLSEQLKVAALA